MARKKKTVSTEIEDLNLVPIMNLVVCLIPMVLVGMSLVKIGVINVNAPRFGMGQAEPSDDEDKPLGLTIAINTDAHSVKDLDHLRFGVDQGRPFLVIGGPRGSGVGIDLGVVYALDVGR